jgi:pectinesterase
MAPRLLWYGLGLAALLSALGRVDAQPPGGAAPAPVRIVLVGDSTVTEGAGWGLGFRELVAGGAEVVNLAASGRSSKSFLDEGRWTEALAKKGQYYLIQFGHNDEPGKGPDRETDPGTTYRANIARFVDEARAIGATPVLVTSLVRRLYSEDGTIRSTQTPYVEAVRALAAEKRVPLVDLHAISRADAEHAGDEVWADLSPRDDQGQVDRTHLNAKGSDVVARMVAGELRKVLPQLARYLPEPGGHP